MIRSKIWNVYIVGLSNPITCYLSYLTFSLKYYCPKNSFKVENRIKWQLATKCTEGSPKINGSPSLERFLSLYMSILN